MSSSSEPPAPTAIRKPPSHFRPRAARLTSADDIPSGPASVGDARPSIWSAIHPRLLELIQAHRSTLIFVNSRRLAERLASALNERAGEEIVRAHHKGDALKVTYLREGKPAELFGRYGGILPSAIMR